MFILNMKPNVLEKIVHNMGEVFVYAESFLLYFFNM